jgi:hypothetical protein
MRQRAKNGTLISRSEYGKIAKHEDMPAATTLERQIGGTWADVAEFFGLAINKQRRVNYASKLDEPRYRTDSPLDDQRYHYNINRDEIPDNGLTVLDTPRQIVWYSQTDGRMYSGQAWVLR